MAAPNGSILRAKELKGCSSSAVVGSRRERSSCSNRPEDLTIPLDIAQAMARPEPGTILARFVIGGEWIRSDRKDSPHPGWCALMRLQEAQAKYRPGESTSMRAGIERVDFTKPVDTFSVHLHRAMIENSVVDVAVKGFSFGVAMTEGRVSGITAHLRKGDTSEGTEVEVVTIVFRDVRWTADPVTGTSSSGKKTKAGR